MAPYLDPQNQGFVDDLAKGGGPPLQDLPYVDARQVLEGFQQHEPAKDVTREEFDAPVGPTGSVKTFIFKPTGATGDLPVIFFFHGGGWILGSPNTHDELVRDIVRETGCAIVFPYYTPAPDAQFPHQFEEAYATVEYYVKEGRKYGLKTDKVAFMGDSVGGHMAIGMSTLSAERKLPAKVVYQALFYPVTDTHAESETFITYKDGPYLSADELRWMYAAFFKSVEDRANILGSPVLMTKEQAATQPSTLIVVSGADPLQDEGKHFGHILQHAGVEAAVFQADGTVHDFVMLEPTKKSDTAKATIELAAMKVKKALTF